MVFGTTPGLIGYPVLTVQYRGGALIPGSRQDCDNLFFKNGMECQCALGAWPMVDAGFV